MKGYLNHQYATQNQCTMQKNIERSMFGTTRRNRKQNEWMRNIARVVDILERLIMEIGGSLEEWTIGGRNKC